MVDDRPHPLASGVLCLLAVFAGPGAGPAHAESVYGSVQVQYEKLDNQLVLIGADGQVHTIPSAQEFWVRTFDVHHQDYLRQDLLLESNARFTEQSFMGSGDYTGTPVGSLRLVHPYVQIFASEQPAFTRTSMAVQTGLTRDSTTARSVMTRNREELLSGHLAVPNWPRVDLTWDQRQRSGDLAFSDRNNLRNARLTFERPAYMVYGTVNDQRISPLDSRDRGGSSQQVWAAGGTGRYSPFKKLSFTSQYDVSDVQSRASGIRQPTSISQSANLMGDWRPSPKWVGSTSYQWRRTDAGTPNIPVQTDQEGSLLERYLFTRRSSALVGLGFRSTQTTSADGTFVPGFQRYLTAMTQADGKLRRNLDMNASLTHTTDWDPERAAYSIETLSGTLRGVLRRNLQADASYQLAANGDSAATGSRYSTTWNARVQGNPLRTLQLVVSARNQRTGPGLFRPSIVLRGFTLDMNWRPISPLQVVGQLGSTDSRPSLSGGTTTRSLTVRFEPTMHWQWYGGWSRSDQTTIVSTAGQLSSREVVSGRVQYAPTRRLASSAGVSYNDPGRAIESRQIDLTLTWSFGR